MSFRIAAVSFMNTVPLIGWFSDPVFADNQHNVEILRALPSELATLLTSGQADVALLPVADIFRSQSGAIIAGTGIASRGNVDSVKFFTATDPKNLKRVLVDRGSHTSVALLRVLLLEKYNIRPEFVVTEPKVGDTPRPDEAILVIGDRCFEFDRQLADQTNPASNIQSYDLSGLWFELTGLPFIFATWALSKSFQSSATVEAIQTLAATLSQARDYGLQNLSTLAAAEAAKGRLGYKGEATEAAVAYYFRESLVYKLGPDEWAGMRLFHQLCIKHGVVPDGPSPEIM